MRSVWHCGYYFRNTQKTISVKTTFSVLTMWTGVKKTVITGGIGLAVLVLGLILLFCFPLLFSHMVQQNLPLANGSISYKVWKDIPIPLYQKVYLFNMTNPEEFLQKASKPRLEEIGPYTYRSWWIKENITWHHNDTVTYRERKKFVFRPELSVGGEDDLITTINFPMVAAAAWLRNAIPLEKVAASIVLFLMKEKIFVQKSVWQLVYEGYPNFLTVIAPLIHSGVPKTHGHFGWLYGKNNTDDGEFTVFTGKGDLNKFGIIEKWNGTHSLKYWTGSCNTIAGSNGELGPPLAKEQKTVTVFQTDFCRSWKLNYKKEVNIRGMKCHRFSAKKSVLANGTDNPENSCFTTRRHLPSGVMDLSPCRYDSPVALSFPHFYLASPSYLRAVEGLKPNASLHEFFLDIHPRSGISTSISARIQLNAILEQDKNIRQFSNITELVLPILWQEVSGYLTKELADELLKDLEYPLLYASISAYCITALGVFVLLISLTLLLYHWTDKKKHSRQESLLEHDGLNEEEDCPNVLNPSVSPKMNDHIDGDV
ncbi:scavenger receptor class B member 1-like isoform X2 [Limulus polyphemus]|uniref:Scavenger receptor class B member 1 n=1 Tax=Limulus polyphemus TaxID=6850 RepID=A0ABM1S5Z2_LIMPO|nr:scavenger receptor class B member 1-like isoform X2 [Limulus polyphemus]